MTSRGFYTLIFGVLMLFTALSVGSAGAFLLGAAALTCWLLALLSVLLAALFGKVSQSIDGGQITRSGSCPYHLSLRMPIPAPIAPLSLKVCLPSGRQSDFSLSANLFGVTESDNTFPCPHVGVYPVGITQITFSDCFGLFSLRKKSPLPPVSVTVLPNPIETEPLAVSPGEGESTTTQRALADHSVPEDIRAWQDGDELKRVHWKLSMRRQSLMVHTYETPQRPDALVLLDCAAPKCAPAARATLIDALTEACAGTLKSLLEAGRATRLPLSASGQGEFSGHDTQALPAMLHAVAGAGYTKPTDFSRVLWLSSRRMQRTGSTAILTTRLTPAVADAALALSRMGSKMRFTLVTAGELSEEEAQLLHLLFAGGLETAHIRAA